MNISSPFILRPIATTLLALALLLAGGAAYTRLPVAPLPRVDFPTISVSANLPGASPETMASSVAAPLERRFGRIAGVTEITSTSSLGNANITLQFDLSRDVDSAARDVQAAINAAGGDLPANLPSRPTYRKVNPADAPILILSLTSDTLPLGQVYDQANTILGQKIAQVPGVGQVFVGGGQQPAVRVQADPVALAGRGLTLEDVRTTLAQSTVARPKGVLSGPARAQAIAVNDQLVRAADYVPIVIAYRNGAPVRLGEVARVFESVENERVAAWTDGRRSVLMIIRRQPGANIIEVIDRIQELLPSLAESISPAIHVKVALDRSQTIRASVADVELTLGIAVVLVVLVVFVVLRSGWATLIPSVAVPLSLIGTFGVMYLAGYSLDNLSLMALTISTGFVVDDAIVVTENIARHLEAGARPLDAALQGARQIGFTIVSITASLLAVFLPILLMGGIVGRLFREFAVTLGIAIAISAVLSLTLTPMMCARLLRSERERRHGRLYLASEHAFEAIVHFYDRTLSWGLRHRWLMLALTVAALAVNVVLYIVTPKGLFPEQDTGAIAGFSDAPQDVSFQSMVGRQQAINEVLLADPAIDHMVSFVGAGPGGSAGNTGTVFLQLKPRSVRKVSAEQVIARLRPRLARVPGIRLFLQPSQDVRVGGRLARTQFQYTLQDADLAELNAWAPRILTLLKGIPLLQDVASDQQTAGLQLNVDIDRDAAARVGIQPSMVDSTLYDAYGQRQVTTFFTEVNQYRVVLEALPEFRQTPESLSAIYVRSPGGLPVPLSAFASTSRSATSLSVNHQGQFPSVTLSFNLAPGASLGQAVDAIRRAEAEIGMPAGLRADFQGTAQVFRASLESEPYLILAALLAVYIVLGVLYESYVHPITILSTLPPAGVGALLALLAFRMDFDIIALIGIILLIGIVKKNAIMMVDFAIEAERVEGLTTEEAIHRASLLRFRPILMTTMAALLGALPLALTGGAGSELRRPLGVAVAGGLLFSQLLTLYTTPVIYLTLDRLSRRQRRRRHGEPETNPSA
ncbi:MAG TPA: multidrug efflux RND transporter permease subunit [Polyangia bacterium]|nr:multidrug efflux RND transporter permease subunit [Polyangia bacterium]